LDESKAWRCLLYWFIVGFSSKIHLGEQSLNKKHRIEKQMSMKRPRRLFAIDVIVLYFRRIKSSWACSNSSNLEMSSKLSCHQKKKLEGHKSKKMCNWATSKALTNMANATLKKTSILEGKMHYQFLQFMTIKSQTWK